MPHRVMIIVTFILLFGVQGGAVPQRSALIPRFMRRSPDVSAFVVCVRGGCLIWGRGVCEGERELKT